MVWQILGRSTTVEGDSNLYRTIRAKIMHVKFLSIKSNDQFRCLFCTVQPHDKADPDSESGFGHYQKKSLDLD
jgi:hypothetical protein